MCRHRARGDRASEYWLTLARLAYHLGNRHVQLALGEDQQGGWVRFPPDHVLEELAERLGATLEHHNATFDPEPGAYNQVGVGIRTAMVIAMATGIPMLTTTTTTTTTTMDTAMPTKPDTSPDLALLGLLQLVSPALPIGAFAFSRGWKAPSNWAGSAMKRA